MKELPACQLNFYKLSGCIRLQLSACVCYYRDNGEFQGISGQIPGGTVRQGLINNQRIGLQNSPDRWDFAFI